MYILKTSTRSSDTGPTKGHLFRLKIDMFSTTFSSLGLLDSVKHVFIIFLGVVTRSDSNMLAVSTIIPEIRESQNAQNGLYINMEYDR